jgi:hypothetical protein
MVRLYLDKNNHGACTIKHFAWRQGGPTLPKETEQVQLSLYAASGCSIIDYLITQKGI